MVDCVETALQPSLMLLHLRLRLSTYGAQKGAFFFMRGKRLKFIDFPYGRRLKFVVKNSFPPQLLRIYSIFFNR
jgi:hypothetical protein